MLLCTHIFHASREHALEKLIVTVFEVVSTECDYINNCTAMYINFTGLPECLINHSKLQYQALLSICELISQQDCPALYNHRGQALSACSQMHIKKCCEWTERQGHAYIV